MGVCAAGRYRAEGEAAFEPRSRRPQTSPRAIPDATAELISGAQGAGRGGLDTGRPPSPAPGTPPRHVVSLAPSAGTCRAGLVTPEPRKRPRSSYIRFAPSSPTSAGSPTAPTTAAGGADAEILTGSMTLPASRYRSTAHHRSPGPSSWRQFRAAAAQTGSPPQRSRTFKLGGCFDAVRCRPAVVRLC